MSLYRIFSGRNVNLNFLNGAYEYITDSAKTCKGLYTGTVGCSHIDPVRDMLTAKKLVQKNCGKQGVHFVMSFTPCDPDISNETYVKATVEFLTLAFPGYQAFYGLHLDSTYKHVHGVLNALNSVTGKKYTMSRSDLNKIRQIANNVLEKYGFDIIKSSANDFEDTNDYSNAKGFEYFELDETVFSAEEAPIKEEDFQAINYDTFGFLGITDSCFIPSSNYFNERNEVEMETPNNLPMTQSDMDIDPVVVKSPCTPVMSENSYPSTNIVTGPTIRINATPDTNLSCLGGILSQASVTDQEMLQSANIAFTLNQKAQENGYPTNVNIIAGPVIEVDLTGGMRNYIEADYTEK